ncbi:hypothetical protein ACIQVL_04900 [Streptomyces sp. NPDC090499]|uniref:hypothetical protein n=1 Tax=Streptomyces sp. NPDC090499 TaxID=3365965 RepID=UPI003806765F
MKLPVDNETLNAWSSLLGLTEEQATDVLKEIETTLHAGYAHRPACLRHRSFDELTTDMDIDELALMFLATGLRHTGHPEAAAAVEIRGLATKLQAD